MHTSRTKKMIFQEKRVPKLKKTMVIYMVFNKGWLVFQTALFSVQTVSEDLLALADGTLFLFTNHFPNFHHQLTCSSLPEKQHPCPNWKHNFDLKSAVRLAGQEIEF